MKVSERPDAQTRDQLLIGGKSLAAGQRFMPRLHEVFLAGLEGQRGLIVHEIADAVEVTVHHRHPFSHTATHAVRTWL